MASRVILNGKRLLPGGKTVAPPLLSLGYCSKSGGDAPNLVHPSIFKGIQIEYRKISDTREVEHSIVVEEGKLLKMPALSEGSLKEVLETFLAKSPTINQFQGTKPPPPTTTKTTGRFGGLVAGALFGWVANEVFEMKGKPKPTNGSGGNDGGGGD